MTERGWATLVEELGTGHWYGHPSPRRRRAVVQRPLPRAAEDLDALVRLELPSPASGGIPPPVSVADSRTPSCPAAVCCACRVADNGSAAAIGPPLRASSASYATTTGSAREPPLDRHCCSRPGAADELRALAAQAIIPVDRASLRLISGPPITSMTVSIGNVAGGRACGTKVTKRMGAGASALRGVGPTRERPDLELVARGRAGVGNDPKVRKLVELREQFPVRESVERRLREVGHRPEADRSVLAGGGDPFSVRRDGHVAHLPGMAVKEIRLFTRDRAHPRETIDLPLRGSGRFLPSGR